MSPLSELTLGSITVAYTFDAETGRVGFSIYPTSKKAVLQPRRQLLNGLPFIDSIPDAGEVKADEIDSLVQLKLAGTEYSGGFAQGETMLFNPGARQIRFSNQAVLENEDGTEIVTSLVLEDLEITHRVISRHGSEVLEIHVSVRNSGAKAISLEMLSSFFLGGLTPFAADDAAGRLLVHRFRSRWSAEGRMESRTLEELHLERSWSGAGTFSERFGQLGSMPVRKWFPFVALEDVEEGVVWGAQIGWAGSWQMEVSRRNDSVCLSGGLADREFGHWLKSLAPGETLTAPMAYLSCVSGTIDDLCHQMVQYQKLALISVPEPERALPVMVNEWCLTWGDPSHQRMVALAESLRANQCSAQYLVIDAGWYKTGTGTWNDGHGDWQPSPLLFPAGLKATADAIRARGYTPGIWFEMETCGSSSKAFQMTDLLLARDGVPLTVRSRRFWDLRSEEAQNYLAEKVIGLIRECGFGYLKVDYNETIGLGCDAAESQGEGLRQQVHGIYRFFDRIRQELPHLVIENCSSGGHRLEPSMLAKTAVSSSSDAHELPEIPIIAANLHRLILPQQSLVWAVLHGTDSPQRLIYTLTATFLGRMCLSGELDRLDKQQWNLVRKAEDLYAQSVPILRDGRSFIQQEIGASWRYPRGRQAVVRIAPDGRSALVVLHRFAGKENNPWTLELPAGNWLVKGSLLDESMGYKLVGNKLFVHGNQEFCGAVLYLAVHVAN